MPVSKQEFGDIKFAGRQISFSAGDCEILYWLVEESGLSDELKLRLTNKLRGYFVSAKTEAQSRKILTARAKRTK